MLAHVDHSDEEVELDYEKERIKRLNKVVDPFVQGESNLKSHFKQLVGFRKRLSIFKVLEFDCF